MEITISSALGAHRQLHLLKKALYPVAFLAHFASKLRCWAISRRMVTRVSFAGCNPEDLQLQ